jgi:DNA-binding NarL/FixJ family response regulator
MRLLVVEDNESFLEDLLPALRVVPNLEIRVARSLEAAETEIRDTFFDAVILDLTLPTKDGLLDLSPSHGEQIFSLLRAECPGTPVIFLTGTSTADLYDNLLQHQANVDLWGDGNDVSIIRLLRKSEASEAVKIVRAYAEQQAATNKIEISKGGSPLQLTYEYERGLQILTRRYGGISARVEPVSGGLSGSPVLRAKVIGNSGAPKLNAIAKLGSAEEAVAEAKRARRLQPLRQGDYSPYLDTAYAGLRGSAATFYRLADGFDESFFAVVARSETDAAKLVSVLRGSLEPWSGAAVVRSVPIGKIRRTYLSDERAAEIMKAHSIAADDVEQREINVRFGCTHGDFHGENILTSKDGRTSLIDFGRVDDACCSIDPVTLELSLLGHPHGIAAVKGWRPDEAIDWRDIKKYAAASPIPTLLHELRSWTHQVALGDDEVHANVYGYCLRQLRFDGPNRAVFERLVKEMLVHLAPRN